MEAEVLDRIPGPPPLRKYKSGPPGRADVFRPPVCPDGHVGRIRIDRVQQNGPFFTRIGYRCVRRDWDAEAGHWTIKRHRFIERTPADPLPRRHPTHEHSYSSDTCPICEHTYAPDEGPRTGRAFVFSAVEIASLLTSVGQGQSIRKATAQARRDALRWRAPTKPHRRTQSRSSLPDWPDEPPPEEDEGTAYAEIGQESTSEEPPWVAAWPSDELSETIGRDRRAKRRQRAAWVLPTPLPDPVEMVGDERFLSRSAATGAEYVDVFGPAVAAPFRREIWPDVMIIDSQPLRRRTVVGADTNARVASDFLCEVFGVVDGLTSEIVAFYPAGGKDQESVKEVFASRRGRPTWIVTDGDPAMPRAIEDAFPAAVHYRCEGHLRMDAQEAAAADRIVDLSVQDAILNCQRTPAHWKALKAALETHAPGQRGILCRWIERNEDLVLHQYELRQRFPDKPHSTGALEPRLTAVRSALAERKFSLRNRRRLGVVLDLMRLEMAHLARPEQYRLLIRRRLEELRSGPIDWRSHWDPMVIDEYGGRRFANSLVAYRDWARGRNTLIRDDKARSDSAARKVRLFADALAQNVADGGDSAGRARRQTPRATTVRPGDMVSDIPEMMRFWDSSKNVGLDSRLIPAQSRTPIDWVCREHEAGDPNGRWPGHLHEWRQSATLRSVRNPGCRFGMRRAACPGNSLRVTHPRLARDEEWDYETNDAAGVTPDGVLHGSKAAVSWLCRRHGPYPMEIHRRAHSGQGCSTCSEEKAEAARQETLAAARRGRYALAKEVRARRAENDKNPS